MQRRLFSKKLFFLFIILYAMLLSESCTIGMMFNTRRVTFNTVLDSTIIGIIPGEIGNIKKRNAHNSSLYADQTRMSVHKKSIDTLTTNIRNYTIVQNKKGYLPSSTPIKRTRFNGLKIIDFAIPAAYIMALTNMKVSPDDPSFYPITIYYPIFGLWANLLPGPWVTYKGKFMLPALIPIKYREDGENRVYIKSLTVDSVNSLVPQEYSNLSSFKRHEPKYRPKNYHLGNTSVAKSDIKDSLNHLLKKWGYIDTTSFFVRLYSGSYLATCEVKSHADIYIGRSDCVIMNCMWSLYTPEGDKKLVEYSTCDTSSWFSAYGAEATTDVMVRSLNNFLKNQDAVRLLKEKYVPPTTPVKIIDTTVVTSIIKPTAADSVKSLSEALEAVVTIKQKDVFFSGCIISSDGYVLTNAHLLNTDVDNADVYVHFSDGDSATAKFVKINSVYDMALYKINKGGRYKSFSPDTSRALRLGDEIYAIGTAQDLDLRQTMTKGIVSAKRKIKDKTLIQFDASINRGSSGGALVTKNGHLIGIINTRLVGDNIQGIGFAIPAYYINEALGLGTN